VDAGCFIIVSVQVTVSLNELGELHEKWECNEKLCTSPLELRRHVIMLNSRNGNWFIFLPIALSSYYALPLPRHPLSVGSHKTSHFLADERDRL
jgi:hypothetical protein